MGYEQYLTDVGAKADLEARKSFLQDLLLAFKAKNMTESINPFQYFHMQQKLLNWVITVPSGYGPYTGNVYTINFTNTVPTADIEAMAKALDWGRANCDDMSQPDHFLSEARLDWILTELKSYLGWP